MHKAIITDLNKCVGCMACSVGCKAVNGVDIGQQWVKIKRVGPYPIEGGSGQFPDVEMYFLPMQCQHCSSPECVTVCPTGASAIAEDGTVQIDAEQCIGCGMCLDACPYGVRYLDEEANVVDKCDLCADRVEQGLLPHCVTQCASRARFFGDLDEGVGEFEGPAAPKDPKAVSYEDMQKSRVKMKDYVEAYEETDIHTIVDSGNGPHVCYLLRAPRKWREEDYPVLSDPKTVEAICDAMK